MGIKDKCKECGGSTVECVSVKDPDIVTVGCFKCGVIVRAYRKDTLTGEEIDVEIETEMKED